MSAQPSPRGQHVSAFINDQKLKKARKQKADFVDRGKGSVADNIQPKDFKSMMNYFLLQENEASVRNRVDLMFLRGLIQRGEITRNLMLSNIGYEDIPIEHGREEFALYCNFFQSKTNQAGDRQHAGIVRHKDVFMCAIGGLALYFFHRFQVCGEPWPDFNRNADWYGAI